MGTKKPPHRVGVRSTKKRNTSRRRGRVDRLICSSGDWGRAGSWSTFCMKWVEGVTWSIRYGGRRRDVSKAVSDHFHASFVQKITECVSSETVCGSFSGIPAGQGSKHVLSYSRR